MAIYSSLLVAVALSGCAGQVYADVVSVPDDRFTFINMPTPLGLPCDMAVGPDGGLWTEYLLAEKFVRIDPITNAVEEYPIPFTVPLVPNASLPIYGSVALAPCVIRAGQDGNMYAGTGLRNQLAKLDLKTKEVSVFTPPNFDAAVGNLLLLNDMWAGPEYMYISQSSADVISGFNYKTEQWETFQVPTPLANPFGMRIAYDNALWFTETIANKLGRLNTTTGHIDEFPLDPADCSLPAVLRVETNNEWIWFTCFLSDSVAGFNIYNHSLVAAYNTAPLSVASVPSVDTKDHLGNIWFSTWTQNYLNYFNPNDRESQTHVKIPQTLVYEPISVPFTMNVGIQYYGEKGKNRIYFTESLFNRVGYLDLEDGM